MRQAFKVTGKWRHIISISVNDKDAFYVWRFPDGVDGFRQILQGESCDLELAQIKQATFNDVQNTQEGSGIVHIFTDDLEAATRNVYQVAL